MTLSISVPGDPASLEDVRTLMRDFLAWHRRRHVEDLRLIDAYFDAAAFEDELRMLPGDYCPPRGQLLLARVDGVPAGCVALRRVDADDCEMKRMFVREVFHGQGVGRALAAAIVEQGRALGYGHMRLDTSIRQAEARGLYQSLGFKEVDPYEELPLEMRQWLVFMKRSLSDGVGR
jgi:GNAT superfamily N-acetyltransferase